MSNTTKSSISLLAPQSTGGINAQSGFDFQHYYVLINTPRWLSRDGFTSLIQEAAGDVELKYFVPSKGFRREFVEIKDHQITPTEYWDEIRRFEILDRKSPGTYHNFLLVAPGLSKKLQPLENGLARLRGPFGFYDEDSEIWKVSYKQYEQIIKNLGGNEKIAYFIYKTVALVTGLGKKNSSGDGIFIKELLEHFPEYNNIPGKLLQQIPESLKNFLRTSVNEVITRRNLLEVIRGSIPSEQCPPMRSITLHTGIDTRDKVDFGCLYFDWSSFWGDPNRTYPPRKNWNQVLLQDILDTRQWILKFSNTRQIKLIGQRRLSATFALGHTFSAVAGFVIDMEYRQGKIWSTNDFPSDNTPGNKVVANFLEGSGDQLVLCISFNRQILSQVSNSVDELELDGKPILELIVNKPIKTPQQANKLVPLLKSRISYAISSTNCKQIHLFYAGPSFMALFLGHRLNAKTPIQCYEWVATNNYMPTCVLV